MNPPDYYPVPSDVLEAAERAFKKYLVSDGASFKLREIVSNMLMGCEWGPCQAIPLNASCTKNNEFFVWGLHYLLPTRGAIIKKNIRSDHSHHMKEALWFFKEYLDESS